MVVVHRAVDLAVHPAVSENLHQFKKLVLELAEHLGDHLGLAGSARGVHHHGGGILVEGIPATVGLGIFKHILNQGGASKRLVGQEPVAGLLDLLDKGLLAVRRHKGLAATLQHSQQANHKVIRILAVDNPGSVLPFFQVTPYLGNIVGKVRPGAHRITVEAHHHVVWAGIPLKGAYGNVGMHLLLHHLSNHPFYGKKQAD